MAAPIPTNFNFPTKNQIPDHSIMDFYNKQAYLGNQFVTDPGSISLGNTSETPLLYLLCPTGSAKSLFVYNMNLNALGGTDIITYRIYSNPTTVTSGSTVTPRNARFASGTTSIATAKSGVSVATNGTRTITLAVVFKAQNTQAPFVILDPGQSLLITGQAGITATAVCSTMHYEL